MTETLRHRVHDATTLLEQTRRIADAELDAADPADFREPINWGDLGVVSVTLGIRDDIDGVTHSILTVLVSEAAPDCVEFQEWLAERIFVKLDLPRDYRVEVRTEW